MAMSMTTETLAGNVRQTARITREILDPYLAGGYKIIAVEEGKKPRMPGNGFYEAPNSDDYINLILTDPSITGFGIAGGDGVVFLDFDDMDFYHRAIELEPELQYYPSELSGKGVHVGLKVDSDETIGSFGIAWVADNTRASGKRVAIEVKGHHGFVVMAPSEHWGKDGPSGKYYQQFIGEMWDLPTITKQKWDGFVSTLASLNQVPIVVKPAPITRSVAFYQESTEREFNAKVEVSTVLLRNGYDQDPRNPNKFRHPHSTSGMFGLNVEDGCAYSYNANDLLWDQRRHNSFDCMRLLECEGDWGAAYRKAEDELGIKPLDIVFGKAFGDNAIKSGRKTINIYGEDLLMMNLAPLQFAVPNLIPQGMTVLAGSPKIGKSWMALQMCIAVATGGTILGETCDQGEALYLSLEDNARRLKERLQKCLPGATTTPVGLTLAGYGSIDALKVGGMEQIRNWVEDHPTTKLIVIDTLEQVKGDSLPNKQTKNAYEADVAFWKDVQTYAQEVNMAILLITHLKKEQSGGDQFNRVTGSIGITGTADTNILLSRDRGSKEAKLLLTSREIEERELDVTFNTTTFKWELAGMPTPGMLNLAGVKPSLPQQILGILHLHGELSPSTVQAFLIEDNDTASSAVAVRTAMIRLLERNEVEKTGRGKYRVKVSR